MPAEVVVVVVAVAVAVNDHVNDHDYVDFDGPAASSSLRPPPLLTPPTDRDRAQPPPRLAENQGVMSRPATLAMLALLSPTLPACAGAGLTPSLVITLRESRLAGADDSRRDRAIEIGLVSTGRSGAVIARTPDESADRPLLARGARARCVEGWTCAWERTRVASTLATIPRDLGEAE